MIKIRKGDNVEILLGKDRGKRAKVEKVFTKEGKVLMTGVNVYKKHVKKYKGIEGGIIEIAKPLEISNVMLVCPNCQKPTRVGYKFEKENKIRICKHCEKEIG